MSKAVALVPVDLQTNGLGMRSRVGEIIAGKTVLARTLHRLSRVKGIDAIVLVHPSGQAPASLLAGEDFALPVETFAWDGELGDAFTAMRISARKVAPASWRGGLGSTTCYDELLCAKPMLAAMEAQNADSLLLVGPDWLLVDPQLCAQVLAIHVENSEALQLTFSQASPGLAGLAMGKGLLAQFVDKPVHIGQLLAYNPQRPQADPIGRDVCLQIPPQVRDCPHRLIYDLPRSRAVIDALARQWDEATFATADAMTVVSALATSSSASSTEYLPRHVTLELTPRRPNTGPITPQHHVTIERPDLSLDDARAIIKQLGQSQDTLLMLGGLGDALLHPQWDTLVTLAHEAGVWGIGIETDLLVEQPVLERLLELPLDILYVRLNADTAAMYRKVMSPNAGETAEPFKHCIENLQWLLNTRNARWQKSADHPQAKAGLPWILPSLVKTRDTLRDMETFFDRWMVYTGQAVIAPATTGCGLMPDQSPVEMAPPRRRPCRQLARRLTIHSDGRLAQCDQDWLGAGSLPVVALDSLSQAMTPLVALKQLHEQGRWDESPLCARCNQWHRP